MNQPVDMYPAQFKRHARAVEARFTKAELRKNDAPLSDQAPESLTVDFAHKTDATNFLLAEWGCPAALRGFIDAVIGVAGYRASGSEWFPASDEQIADRAGRCTKWVQDQRKELIKWQVSRQVS